MEFNLIEALTYFNTAAIVGCVVSVIAMAIMNR